MKVIFSAFVFSAMLSLGLHAQGTVTFNNINPTNLSTRVINGVTGLPQPVGGTLVLALYGGAAGVTNPATLVQLQSTTALSSAGYFNGGTRTNEVIAGGAAGTYQVRAWDSVYGSTYEQFLLNAPVDALQGVSALFTSSSADPNGLPPGSPVSLAFTFPGMVVVPEPSTYALGALGLGVAWFVRRRRQQ